MLELKGILAGRKSCFLNAFLIFSLLALFVFTSCGKRKVDYAVFPANSILKGQLADGRTLYLIREDGAVDNMPGFGFIYEGKAVVDTFSYNADIFGNIDFIIDNRVYTAEASVKSLSQQLIISVKKNPDLGIKRGKIKLKYSDMRVDHLECKQRFKEPVFENIVSHCDIQYGKAMGYYTSYGVDTIPNKDMEQIRGVIMAGLKRATGRRVEVPLHLDVYEPENDSLTKRPLVLFIHGGAFFFGDKQCLLQNALTDDWVRRGYVVASINYRLGSTIWGTGAIEKTIYRGMKDTRSALRYLIDHAEELRIDPEQIYLSGSSAGAIIALNTTFMDEDEIFKSVDRRIDRSDLGMYHQASNSDTDKFNIAGLISMWGGVVDVGIIDERDVDIPVLLFHGTSDDIVYCESGLPFQDALNNHIYNKIADSWKIHGSASIYSHMSEHNMPVKYVPFEGCGHEPQVDEDGAYNDNMTVILDESSDFLYSCVSAHSLPYNIIGTESVPQTDLPPVYYIDNSTPLNIQWKVEGGLVVKNSGNAISVVWFDSSEQKKILVCVTNQYGISCQKELLVEVLPD
ncbi:alpha/beta hydrolase [Paludibacter sp. 221]|uniref:alpha/beta hydrolase n=1 Tax=Paludibacter sp. 221 TaxID=2302939 RepID=UPI0013CFCECA|nr:alpha/beta hydrolase [Paludibacter sp. 221]NDV47432.1 alpha/beta hydrolase [Paludibacter sp. 221]